MTDVNLAIKMTADASDAAGAFDSVGDAASDMATQVDNAAAKADNASDRMTGMADSADHLGSKSSQAAGGLGDLGGVMAGLPGPLGAVGSGMESLAPLVMGVTGAADLANLALESNAVVTAKARAAAIAKGVADKGMAAASKVAAVGQWALNAAMSANPIGIVVLAVAALVAGLVLAYNKSETFRNIVDGAMKGAKTAVSAVVDVVGNIVNKVQDASAKFPVLSTAISTAKDLIVGYFEVMTFPIRTVIDLVQKVIDLIGKIKLPDLSGVPGLRTSTGSAAAGGPFSHEALGRGAVPEGGTVTVIERVTFAGPVYNGTDVARQLVRELRRYGVVVGTA